MLARKAFPFAAAIARAVLPTRLRLQLGSLLLVRERARAAATEQAFLRRDRPLVHVTPLLSADQFAAGPIALCNHALAWGGAERQVVNTLKGLAARQERPAHLFCLRLNSDADYEFFKKALTGHPGEIRNVADVHAARAYLAALAPKALSDLERAVAWMPADIVEEIVRFAGDFARLRPAIVHAWQDSTSISVGYAAYIVGVPRILLSGRNMAPWRFAYYRPHLLHGYRELASIPRITLLNNSVAGATDYASWLGLSPERIRVLRNGIDQTSLKRPDAAATGRLRSDLGIPSDAPVVGSIFRFYAEKRPLLWLETAAAIATRVPNSHFVVFGTGPLKADVARLAQARGLAARMHLPGTIDDTALALSLMDVFLLTSEFEGTPNAVLEASLLGCPVVATDAGGTREAIAEGHTGHVVPADAGALAVKVVDVLANRAWRDSVRNAGPTFVEERFGLDRMIAETLEAYGLVSGAARPTQ